MNPKQSLIAVTSSGWVGGEPNKRIKSRCGVDAGMMENLILAGACVLAIYAALGAFAWWLRREMEEIVNELDQNLALAIQKVVSDHPLGDIEPPNPMQMFLMEMIRDNVGKKTLVTPNRDDAGLFTQSEG